MSEGTKEYGPIHGSPGNQYRIVKEDGKFHIEKISDRTTNHPEERSPEDQDHSQGQR